jgi:hypothetical protein
MSKTGYVKIASRLVTVARSCFHYNNLLLWSLKAFLISKELLGTSKRLYNSFCPSVGRSVGPLVGPSVSPHIASPQESSRLVGVSLLFMNKIFFLLHFLNKKSILN